MDDAAQQPLPDSAEPIKTRMLRLAFETVMRLQGKHPGQVRFLAAGHSHLDAAWRWRAFQTRSKAKLTFRNALRNIDQYPEFSFAQSSPQFYEWMKDRQPRIFRAIQNAAKRGRWDIVGGCWIEPDGNMPDGESFVRQRLYGQRFYLDHFGKVSEIEWLPDTFGFAWTLPQIFVKSGAKYFWTTKLLWNDTNNFPLRTFLWRGPDGTEILTHVSPLFGVNANDFFRTVSANRILPPGEELEADYSMSERQIRRRLDRKPLPEAFIAYGLGDGGGGPTPAEIDIMRTLQAADVLDIGTPTEFFSRLEQYRDRLPVWNDELYLEFHRGCLTTQGLVKRYNRRLELKARDAEIVHSMNSLFGDPYPEDELREVWKTILFHQFHDILPGSSIPEVYDDAYEAYERVETQANDLIRGGLYSIARRIATHNPALQDMAPLVVYNTLSWDRTGEVRLEVTPARTLRVFNADGSEAATQKVALGNRFFVMFTVSDVPGMGYRTYYVREEKPGAGAPESTPWNEPYGQVAVSESSDGSVILENEFLKVTVDAATGWISSIIDKMNAREMLDGPANELRLYRDSSMVYPAWNIDPHYREKEIPIEPHPEMIEVRDRGPVAGTVAVRRMAHTSPVTQEIRLVAGRPFIYCATVVDWQEKKALLKTWFHTAIKSDTVAAEIPYGVIERPTRPRSRYDKARWEMPCQKWFGLDDGRYGIAVLNDGKYGFSCEGSSLGLTLLRGPRYPAAVVNAWGLSEPASDRPRYTDQGIHVMRYAIFPHSGSWRDAKLWRRGLEFNAPFITMRTSHHQGAMPPQGSSLICDAETTYIAAIKRPEDNPGRHDARFHQLVVRLVEAAGEHDTVRLTFHGPLLELTDVNDMDLLEFSSGAAGLVEAEQGAVTLNMKPFEIRTIKVTLIGSGPDSQDS